MKIVERSDGLWHFACGDVSCRKWSAIVFMWEVITMALLPHTWAPIMSGQQRCSVHFLSEMFEIFSFFFISVSSILGFMEIWGFWYEQWPAWSFTFPIRITWKWELLSYLNSNNSNLDMCPMARAMLPSSGPTQLRISGCQGGVDSSSDALLGLVLGYVW